MIRFLILFVWHIAAHMFSYHQFEHGRNSISWISCTTNIFINSPKISGLVAKENNGLQNRASRLGAGVRGRGWREAAAGGEGAGTAETFFRKIQTIHWKQPFREVKISPFKIWPLNCSGNIVGRLFPLSCNSESIYRIFTIVSAFTLKTIQCVLQYYLQW